MAFQKEVIDRLARIEETQKGMAERVEKIEEHLAWQNDKLSYHGELLAKDEGYDDSRQELCQANTSRIDAIENNFSKLLIGIIAAVFALLGTVIGVAWMVYH